MLCGVGSTLNCWACGSGLYISSESGCSLSILGAYKILWYAIFFFFFLLYYTFSPFTFRAFIHFEKFGGQDFDVKGLT